MLSFSARICWQSVIWLQTFYYLSIYCERFFSLLSLSLSLSLSLCLLQKNFFFKSQLSYLEIFANIIVSEMRRSFVSVMKLTACEKITKRTRDESSPNRGSKWPWKRLDTPTNRWGSISIILFTSYFLSISTEKLDKNYIFSLY